MTLSPAAKTFLGVGVLFLLILAGYYSSFFVGQPTPAAPATTTTQTLSDGTIIGGLPEGAILTEVPPVPAPKAPNFRATVVYGASVSADVRAAIEPRLAADIALLSVNPDNFNAWMDIAILRKIGGDYRGAEEIWLYATKHWPKSVVPFQNLADLYQNFLNDPAKAKVYTDLAAGLATQ